MHTTKKLQIAVFSRFLYSYKIWIVHTAVCNLLTIFPFGQDPEKLPARLCLSCFLAIVWNKKPFGLRVIRADIWYTIPYEFKHFGWQIVYIREFCNISYISEDIFFAQVLNTSMPYYGAKFNFKVGIIFPPISTKRKNFWKTFPNRMFYMYVRNLEVLFYVGVNAVCILQCVINIMDSWAHIRVLRQRKRHKYVWEKRQFFLLLISLGIL